MYPTKGRKMGTLEILSREHKEVLERLALLGVTIQGMEKTKLDIVGKSIGELNKNENLKGVREFLTFFEKDVLFHFKIEEEVVFPQLKRIAGVEEAFISKLLSEHSYLVNRYSELQNFMKNLNVMNGNTFRRYVNMARDIIKKLTTHAQKEERKLMPFAKKVLSQNQLEEIEKIIEEMKN